MISMPSRSSARKVPQGTCPTCSLDRDAAWAEVNRYRHAPGTVQWQVTLCANLLRACRRACGPAGGWT